MNWRFGIGYAVLGAAVLIAVCGFVLGILNANGKADKATVQKIETQLNPTVKDAIQSACAYVAQDANANGVVVSECRLYRAGPGDKPNPYVDGDSVTIALVVKTIKGDYYLVGVKMNKGVYQPVGQLQILPQGKKAPPSREIS